MTEEDNALDGLIERLRSVDVSWSETGEWCAEAANRIEALEEALAQQVEACFCLDCEMCSRHEQLLKGTGGA